MASPPIVKALLPGLSKPEFAGHLRIGRVGLALLAQAFGWREAS